MATSTPNFGLYKYEGNDAPDLTKLNTSMDKIDTQMKTNSFNWNNSSLWTQGFQVFPSGLIIQWGSVLIDAQPETSSNGVIWKQQLVTFAIPFPNACLSVTTSSYRAVLPGHASLSKTGMTLTATKQSNVWESSTIYYVAIGY